MGAAKAIVAGIIAGLAALSTSWHQTSNVDTGTIIDAVLSVFVAFNAVYFVTNKATTIVTQTLENPVNTGVSDAVDAPVHSA